MPRFDYTCPLCGCQLHDHSTKDPNCPECFKQGAYVLMTKLPSAPNFVIKGFNAKNGYSK